MDVEDFLRSGNYDGILQYKLRTFPFGSFCMDLCHHFSLLVVATLGNFFLFVHSSLSGFVAGQ